MFNDKDDIKLTDTQSTKLDDERSKREDSSRMKRFKEVGLIGCLNETGITSENYKDEMRCSEHCGNTVREVQ